MKHNNDVAAYCIPFDRTYAAVKLDFIGPVGRESPLKDEYIRVFRTARQFSLNNGRVSLARRQCTTGFNKTATIRVKTAARNRLAGTWRGIRGRREDGGCSGARMGKRRVI